MLWCINIAEPYFRRQWEIFALIQTSRNGRDMQGRMALRFPHQVLLWMNSELDLGHLCRDA